jgi:hypothetical protein
MDDLRIDFDHLVCRCELRPATVTRVEDWLQTNPKDAQEWGDALPFMIGRIVRTAKARKMQIPAETIRRTVTALANYKRTPVPFHEIALKCASTVGMINPETDHGDPLSFWLGTAQYLHEMFSGSNKEWIFPPGGKRQAVQVSWPHPAAQVVGQMDVLLVPGESNQKMLAIRPSGLMEALKLYAARMIASGTTFHTCEQCHTPFLGGAGGSGKRGDARFCSDKCRWTYHNEVRRNSKS